MQGFVYSPIAGEKCILDFIDRVNNVSNPLQPSLNYIRTYEWYIISQVGIYWVSSKKKYRLTITVDSEKGDALIKGLGHMFYMHGGETTTDIYIESLSHLNSIFGIINTYEPLPEKLIKYIKLACGYEPIVFSMAMLKSTYSVNKDQALKDAQESDEVDKALYALGYLAQTSELPSTPSLVIETPAAGAGGPCSAEIAKTAAAEPKIEIDPQFALDCYRAIPESSEYYKQANYQASLLLLSQLSDYKEDEKPELYELLIECAYKSKDWDLLNRTMSLASGKTMAESYSADSVPKLLAQLASELRAKAPTSSAIEVITPARAAMQARAVSSTDSAIKPTE